MPHFFENISNGIFNRVKRIFNNPYNLFNISIVKAKILKHKSDIKIKYVFYKEKYKVAFRNAPVLLFSIDELFVREFYKFKTERRNPRILDCGSYIGTSILYFKDNYPGAHITGFEPDEGNYQILKMNVENWKFSDVIVNRAAIWTKTGNISFNALGSMSSRIDNGESGSSNIGAVPCFRLKELLNEDIDFLKIDIEGAEYEVLKDCSQSLDLVRNLFVEYHGNYDEMYKLNEILDILLKNNFKYYIKEADVIHERPFWDRIKKHDYDVILNIFAFKE